MKLDAIKNVYKRYAPYYDVVFGRILDHGRREILKQMEFNENDRILEIGVGTGISLISYPSNTKVNGIDISPEMLVKAQERIDQQKLKHVTVEVMDAQCMGYPDNSFDKLAIMYVVSVVPDSQKLMLEAKRVCKPDGDIYIVNHFSKNTGFIHFFEKRLNRLADKLGWQPEFSIDKFIMENKLNVIKKVPVNLFGYWTLLYFKNDNWHEKSNYC